MNILTSISALFDVLFIRWNVSPYLLHVGHFAVRWYGLLFITGFILGYWMFTKIYKAEALPLKLLDPMLYMLLTEKKQTWNMFLILVNIRRQENCWRMFPESILC